MNSGEMPLFSFAFWRQHVTSGSRTSIPFSPLIISVSRSQTYCYR